MKAFAWMFPERALDEVGRREWSQYLEDWLGRFDRIMSLAVHGLALAYFTIGLPIIPFTVPKSHQAFAITAHLVGIAVPLGMMAFRNHLPVAPLTALGAFVMGIGFAIYNLMGAASTFDTNQRWNASLASLFIFMLLGGLFPYHRRRLWIVACLFFGPVLQAVSAFSILPGRFAVALFLVGSINTIIGKLLTIVLIKHLAYQEYIRRRSARDMERQKYEHELMLARRIQESFAAPRALSTPFGAEIRIFSRSFHAVGGDWVAVRVIDDERVIIMVVDAAGKGMQAALVVHAVQSLWADSLNTPGFDAHAWVARLNQTLFQMGRTEPHSVTLGIVELTPDRLTYWSAGHTPIICGHEPFHKDNTVSVLGSGSVLGILPDCMLQPISHSFDRRLSHHVVLGSDGIIPGPSVSRKLALRLMRELTESGQAALDRIEDVEDDQTLVWVTYRPKAA